MRSPKLGKPFSSKDSLLLGLGLLLFVCAGAIHSYTKKPELVLSKQDTALNVNTDLLKIMSFGNKRLISDLIWVQTLMESDVVHYTGPAKLNWMFLRFKTISLLDPQFYENYSWGGQYLSIIKDDMLGGNELMEQGLKFYPDDYQLHYLLGFSYYHELSNYDKGIFHFEKIMDHPRAPYFLQTIVYKMKMEKGFSFDTALPLIQTQIEKAKEERVKIKLIQDYYALKAERDLKCLNQKKAKCDSMDAKGEAYYLIGTKYYSKSYFVPYRLSRKDRYKKIQSINTME